MDTLIQTRSLAKIFDGFTAVKDVSLTVNAGEVLALLGPNGAGKTTTIRMIASILRPTTGTATVAGFDVEQDPEKVRHSVGLLTEHHGLYNRMRAWEYLEFFGRIYALPDDIWKERAGSLLSLYGLNPTLQLRLGQYSKGMRQKLALVRALLHDPRVLLLDEPTSAMDPESAHLVRESIRQFRSNNRAIIVCTHNLHEAEALADRIAIIRRGAIIANDTTSALKHSLVGDPVMELRLGVSLDGVVERLPDDLTILAQGPDWIRYQTASPETMNPQILESLTRANIPVLTLSEVHRSLEDIYLQIIQTPEGSEEIRA
ncbi:MAG: ABC transporter ATP-binding protein [Anaerolineales bacterium]|nr:MAG: ABC transporter ATP-binding protein [Anaerolineales bacterium]